MSTVGLAGEWLRARGIRPVSNDATSIVRQAMTARQPFMSGPGFHTTSRLPGDPRRLDAEVARQPVPRRRRRRIQVVGTGTMPDFRTKTLGKLSSFPALKPIAESGEFTWGTLEEAGEKISVGTFGRAIAVSLQVMVNDNLGAVQRSLRDVAFAAVNLKAVADPRRDADHRDERRQPAVRRRRTATTSTPARSASPRSTRSAPRCACRRPSTGPPCSAWRRRSCSSRPRWRPSRSSSPPPITPTQPDHVNPFSGIRIAVEPRLDAVDPAAHYVFADPAVMPAIEFDTLEGTPAPRLEVADPADFDRLGSAYRVWWACGAAPIEHRAAVRNSGTTA